MASPNQRRKTGVPPPPFPKLPPKKNNHKSKENSTKAIVGRKLYWDALQRNKIEGTVFAELTRESSFLDLMIGNLNVDQLQQVFSPQEKAKGSPSVPPGPTPKVAEVFSVRRAQNIGIVLARFPKPVDVVAQDVIQMSIDSVSVEILEKLIDVAPNEAELKEFKLLLDSDSSSKIVLRDVEKKYLPLVLVPCLKERCEALLAYKQLSEYVSEIEKSFDCLYDAGRQIRKSEKFRFLLIAVLVWGNLINHGTHKNDIPVSKVQKDAYGRTTKRKGTEALVVKTFGFTLASLLKLCDFKTTIDSSISSLHYIVAHMMESKPQVELHSLCDDFSMVPLAARINAQQLKEQLNNIEKKLHFLDMDSTNIGPRQLCCQDALKALSSKHTEYSKRCKELKERYEEVTTFVNETAAYFGDDMTKNGPEGYQRFFQTLEEFLKKFQSCVDDIAKNKEKFKRLLIESAKNEGLMYVKLEESSKQERSSKLLLKESLSLRPGHKSESRCSSNVVENSSESSSVPKHLKEKTKTLRFPGGDSTANSDHSASSCERFFPGKKGKEAKVDTRQVSFILEKQSSSDLFYKRSNERHRTITSAHASLASSQNNFRSLISAAPAGLLPQKVSPSSNENDIYQMTCKSLSRSNSSAPDITKKPRYEMSLEETIDIAITIFSVSEPIDVLNE